MKSKKPVRATEVASKANSVASNQFRISKRTFLKLLAGGMAVGILSFPPLLYLRNRIKVEFKKELSSGRLSAGELETIIALLEVLLPRKLYSDQEELTKLVNQATQSGDGVFDEYRAGAALLNHMVDIHIGKFGFAKLSLKEREHILDPIMWRYDYIDGDGVVEKVWKFKFTFDRLLHSEIEKRFRELVVRDLLQRFYGRADIAWQFVNYSNYPGVPGNSQEYTRAGRI
jgi:hypothetical protein